MTRVTEVEHGQALIWFRDGDELVGPRPGAKAQLFVCEALELEDLVGAPLEVLVLNAEPLAKARETVGQGV